jgi:hypothetical protein
VLRDSFDPFYNIHGFLLPIYANRDIFGILSEYQQASEIGDLLMGISAYDSDGLYLKIKDFISICEMLGVDVGLAMHDREFRENCLRESDRLEVRDFERYARDAVVRTFEAQFKDEFERPSSQR